jgi:putative redox protein
MSTGKRPTAVTLTLESVEGEGLRLRADTGGGRSTLLDSGPGRIAASPVEMLLVSLGGCVAMDVISILRKQRQRVTAYVVELHGERHEEHPRSYTRIEVLHRLTGHALDRGGIEHAIELSRTKYCSVSLSLDPAIVLTHRIEILPAQAEALPHEQE